MNSAAARRLTRRRLALRVGVATMVTFNPATLGSLRFGNAWAGQLTVPLVAVPKAQCQPGDRVETGLQGQVPMPDRVNGRAAQGYQCNLTLIGDAPA